MIRQQRQHDPGEDQKFAGGDDFLDLDPARQRVQLLAAGEQENRRHGDCHRHPGRQRQRGGAQHVSEHIEQRNNEADIDVAISIVVGLFLMLADMGAVIDEQPGAQYQEAGGKRQEMDGIEQIKRAAGEREQGKSADAARPPLIGVGEEFLEGEPEKKAQAQQQRDARRGGCCDHGGVFATRDRGRGSSEGWRSCKL